MEFDFDKVSYLIGADLPIDEVDIVMFLPPHDSISSREIYIGTFPILVPLRVDENKFDVKRNETYDIAPKGYVRTEGDKWIIPNYQPEVRGLLEEDRNSNWFIGDISMLNGSGFSHSGHNHGRELDIVYGQTTDPAGSGYNFIDNISTANWKYSLDQIEDFIITSDVSKIADIRLTFSKELGVGNEYKPVARRFHNRCIKNTHGDQVYSSLDEEKGSFLLDTKAHSDHLHVNLNAPDALGWAKERTKNNELESDFIGDLVFSVANGNKLNVAINSNVAADKYANKTIYWRFQSSDNFTDDEMTLCAGNTRVVASTTYARPSSVGCSVDDPAKPRKFIYAMVVDNSTGECLPIDNGNSNFLEIDL
jgi:hypothetical protein